MKKLFILFLSTGLLASCTSENTNKAGNKKESSTTDIHINERENGLILNDGSKWKADSPTLANADNLQDIISKAKTESLEEYLSTGAQLQQGLNKMIKECKMKGADHDALHHWLEPLIEQTKELNNATEMGGAGEKFREVEKQVSLFPQFFEQR